MNKEKQRIAIAEACPEAFRINNLGSVLRKNSVGEWVYCNPLNDLNAMHEAENCLRTKGVVWVDYENRIGKCFTAEQRAESFLRTIGKWEDTNND